MANINDLKRHHKEIYEIIDYLKSNLEEGKVQQESRKLAQSICTLAGKLKIHLISEDDCLYPRLLGGTDIKAKETAERFSKEMGNLSQVFLEYKSKYNISSRILGGIQSYINDTRVVTDAMEKRMKREDKELYTLL